MREQEDMSVSKGQLIFRGASMNTNLSLLPAPRRIQTMTGWFFLPDGRLILIDHAPLKTLYFSAQRIKTGLHQLAGVKWELEASTSVPQEEVGLTLRIDAHSIPQAQGYRLSVLPDNMQLLAHDAAGIFYGVCTLLQMLEQFGQKLPCLEIEDWPDYPVRGVMLDISRDKVYSMETLYALVDKLASWKVNQLQFYTEHTFAYHSHPEIWEGASPLTGEEVMALDAFCAERFMELVPNQNSFGHLRSILKHPRYAHLAETHGEFQTPWGVMQGPFSLAPANPGSIALLQSLYDELLPHFSSRTFNVGCDEALDVGQGQSRELCQQKGVGRVYLDFLLKIYADAARRGYRMQFWGDMILQYPELIRELPKDATALLWGYEGDHPFDDQAAALAASELPFYVCPGTSAWCSLAGRTDNCLANQRNAAESGLKNGASGYLNTDWGDYGHWQVLPVSYLGLLAGAAYAWCLDGNRKIDLTEPLSRYAFEDASGQMGRLSYQLGNVYRTVGLEPPNSSALFWILQWPLEKLRSDPYGVGSEGLHNALIAIDEASMLLEDNHMNGTEGRLVFREYANTIRLMRHACRRGLLALEGDDLKERHHLHNDLYEILDEYTWIWLQRNRPGGLGDSLDRFNMAMEDYDIS
jgi:hexosaminidase